MPGHPSPYHLLSTLEMWKGREKEITLQVHGFSMAPLITPDDRISLRLMKAAELKTGDVLAYWGNGNIITHRLIRKRRSHDKCRFLEKGDNVLKGTWISDHIVLGKVVKIHKQRRFLDMTRWPWTWVNPILGFAVSCLLFAAEKLPVWKRAADRGQTSMMVMGFANTLTRLVIRTLLAPPLSAIVHHKLVTSEVASAESAKSQLS